MSDVERIQEVIIDNLRARIAALEATLRKFEYPPEHRVTVAEARIAALEAALREAWNGWLTPEVRRKIAPLLGIDFESETKGEQK